MSIESNNTPAKDASLIIGWDEVIKRALKQESFINNYNDSIKINDIKQLYKKYVTFLLYGANNTPLFHYDSKIMVSDAKIAYTNILKSDNNSKLIESIKAFLNVLKKNDYKLTGEVENYRKSIVDNIK
ncbi:hypothetical protein [Clostridium sp. DJ247]|uniref:hypothetical protein n=1 Tax=Clostridium sp. DJ247 TaxID=2726188 RepID=UPI00162A2290|nr:hypothetical protein [Clostridium sp. DJ247]MBC2581481.1 hypothetical protein [Clostridium sp. DJ247]